MADGFADAARLLFAAQSVVTAIQAVIAQAILIYRWLRVSKAPEIARVAHRGLIPG